MPPQLCCDCSLPLIPSLCKGLVYPHQSLFIFAAVQCTLFLLNSVHLLVIRSFHPVSPKMPRTYREVSLEGGCTVCNIRVFKNLQLTFLTSRHGLIKIFELFLILLCQKIIYDFGIAGHRGHREIQLFYTIVSMALMQSGSFIVIYCLSANTFKIIRSSLLEMVSTALLLVGFVAALGLLCTKGEYFKVPSRFWTGRPNEPNETMLYVSSYLGKRIKTLRCYKGG